MPVLAVAVLAGCSSPLVAADGGTTGIPPELKSQLDAAAATWAATKDACSTYSYDRRFMSVFGSGNSTEIEIQNDVPTRRRQSILTFPQPDAAGGGWVVEWDEVGDLVGQHQEGFSASTVEELLATCASVLAHDPANFYLSLTVEAHGVPTLCTYFPHGCADDCAVGITIQNFACSPLAN